MGRRRRDVWHAVNLGSGTKSVDELRELVGSL
jgi:hypothetical protein